MRRTGRSEGRRRAGPGGSPEGGRAAGPALRPGHPVHDPLRPREQQGDVRAAGAGGPGSPQGEEASTSRTRAAVGAAATRGQAVCRVPSRYGGSVGLPARPWRCSSTLAISSPPASSRRGALPGVT